jgi:tetratricopeptide (TPR) repeat protein
MSVREFRRIDAMSNRPLKNKKKVVVEEEALDHEVEYRPPGKTTRDHIIQIGVVILILSFFLAPMLVFVMSPAPQPAQQQQQQVNENEEQIKFYSGELAKKPNDPTVLANLGYYTTMKAAQMPPTPENENLRQTLLKESEGNLRKALENDPKYGFAQAELARNLTFQKNFDEAAAFLDQALKSAEDNLGSSDTAVAAEAQARKIQLLGLSAELLLEKKDIPGALAKMDDAIKIAPGNPQLYKQRAVVHYTNNDKDAARKDLTTMVDIGQKSGDQNAAMEGQMMLQILDQPAQSPTPGATPATGTTPAAGPVTVVTPSAAGTPVTVTLPATPAAPATP